MFVLSKFPPYSHSSLDKFYCSFMHYSLFRAPPLSSLSTHMPFLLALVSPNTSPFVIHTCMPTTPFHVCMCAQSRTRTHTHTRNYSPIFISSLPTTLLLLPQICTRRLLSGPVLVILVLTPIGSVFSIREPLETGELPSSSPLPSCINTSC